MLHHKKIIASALVLAIGAGLTGGAIAQTANRGGTSVVAQTDATTMNSGRADREANELQAIQSAKLTIGDAAKAAETEAGGKAVEVSIEDEDGQVAYEVEVALADGTMKEVQIDANTGKVLKVSADSEDQDGEEDGEQDDD